MPRSPSLSDGAARAPTPTDGASGIGDGGIDDCGLMGDRLRVLQPRRGYRAGLDAGLLAAAVGGGAGEQVLEVGCGVGGAVMQAALRAPATRFVGIERDPDAYSLCLRNVSANALSARIEVRIGDVADGFAAQALAPFDAAFANPPFFDDPTRLRGPAPARRGAWLADAGLAAWIRFLVAAVRDGGRITLIHRADRLGDILSALAPSAGSVEIRPVQPFAERPAKRILVRAIRGGRAPLSLLPALVLHETTSQATPHLTALADAILRGEARLGWAEPSARARQSA